MQCRSCTSFSKQHSRDEGRADRVLASQVGWLLRECNDWGGRGYVDSVPGAVTKTAPFGDRNV